MPPSRTTHTIPLSLSQLQYTSSLFYSSPRRVILAHRYHDLARRTRPRPTRPHHHYHHHNAPNTKPNPTFLPRRHSFSTSTPARHEHEQNYYEILEIPITATTQEIKKYTPPFPLPPHTDHHTNPVPLENSTPSPSSTTRTATEPTQQQAHASRKSQPRTLSSSTPINAPRTTGTMGFTTVKHIRTRRRGRIAVTVRICTRAQPGTRGHGRRVG